MMICAKCIYFKWGKSGQNCYCTLTGKIADDSECCEHFESFDD